MGDAIQNGGTWDAPRPSALGGIVAESEWMRWTGSNNKTAVVAKNERFYSAYGRWLDEDTIYWTGPNADEVSAGNMTVMTALVNHDDGTLSDIVDEGAPGNRPQTDPNNQGHCYLAGIDVSSRLETSSSDLYVRGDKCDGVSGSLMAVDGIAEGNVVGTLGVNTVARHNGNGVVQIYMDSTNLKCATYSLGAGTNFAAGTPATLYSSESAGSIDAKMLTKDNVLIAWINDSTGVLSAGVCKVAAAAEVAGAKKAIATGCETTLAARKGVKIVRMSATRAALVYIALGGSLRVAIVDINLAARTITAPGVTFEVCAAALVNAGTHDAVMVDPVNMVLMAAYVKSADNRAYARTMNVSGQNSVKMGREVGLLTTTSAVGVGLMKHPTLDEVACFICYTGANDTQFRLLKP